MRCELANPMHQIHRIQSFIFHQCAVFISEAQLNAKSTPQVWPASAMVKQCILDAFRMTCSAVLVGLNQHFSPRLFRRQGFLRVMTLPHDFRRQRHHGNRGRNPFKGQNLKKQKRRKKHWAKAGDSLSSV